MSLSLNHQALLHDVANYWNGRAASYSQANQEELHSIKKENWQRIILANAPKKERLNVLDIGTGPGFFAIIMALAGHKVTALDATPKMLEQAKQNAKDEGVEIDFQQQDVHILPFETERFDLIVTRNVTWNLDDPTLAYAEWFRVLKKGGRLINFDANWYLHLFDENFKKGFEQDRANTVKFGVADHYANPNTQIMSDIAKTLPLSQKLRPQWDMGVLLDLGFEQFVLDTKISEKVWDFEEKINGASTPMFMIVAQK